MTGLLVGLLLAIAWMAITASFTLPNLLLGLVIGLMAMVLVRGRTSGGRTARRLWLVLALAGLFVRELLASAVGVAALVLTPRLRQRLRPGFIAFPLTAQSDREITLLANLITLTPGTLSVDVSEDRRTLFIHALDVPDREALVRSLADGFERRVIEVFR